MKNLLPLIAFAFIFASCEKEEEIKPLLSPIPPATISVTYLVHSQDSFAGTLSRKITYASGWKKDDGGNTLIPVLTTVHATGNFTVTVEMPAIHVPLGSSYPGKFRCMVPSGIAWESTDATGSFTVVEIKNENLLVARASGGCIGLDRPYFSADVYARGIYW